MDAGIWMLGALTVGPVQFDVPVWLWLIPALGMLSILIARKSLSGLGTWTRWIALGLRLAVIALIAGTLAEPSWRRESKSVGVTVVLDVSDSVPPSVQRKAEEYLQKAAEAGPRQDGDQLGLVTIARQPLVQQLPTKDTKSVERGYTGKTDATDISASVRLALAVAPTNAANKLVLVSDGNETVGSVLSAVAAAQAAGVPISILPLTYRYDREVLMDRMIAPATARVGENVTLKVVLSATTPTTGTLSLRDDQGPVDLDPGPATGVRVKLDAGSQTFPITVPVQFRGPNRFEAVFEPDTIDGKTVGDTRLENNRQTAVTFVSSEGRLLVVREDPTETAAFVKALRASAIVVDETDTAGMPKDLVQMNGFDGIVLANVPRTLFSEQQMVDLQRYVRENGGGLMMTGGKDSFGAGIWMDTPVADALPLDLNPPQKKEMPKGCLGIWVHSVEMSDGRFLGQKTCTAAVDALSSKDEAGIAEWGPSGPAWVHPIQVLGDKSGIKRAINRLTFGDMTDWTPALQTLLKGMEASTAGQKHCILISDGDPMRPSDALLNRFRNASPPISITTVAIACHGLQDQSAMEHIATFTGGRFYNIKPGQENKVPEIFIKEAITIHRPLIREGDAFAPKMTGITAETFAGITRVPPVTGYIRAAEKGGLALVTLKNDEDEPMMAQWQYGLGRSIAYTSDLGARWSASWSNWGQYAAFWSQQVRWVMRPSNNKVSVRVTPESKGDETLLIVEAATRDGERLSFATFTGRLASPDGSGDQDIVLREIGPGRYEGRVSTVGSGTYIASLRYRAPMGDGTTAIEGSVLAAINRPFADEYRTLRDNVALLDEVKNKTAGATLPPDPAASDLWNREGLKFPVSMRPIWLFVAASAIGLFLMDVAVRRVRIDVLAMAGALRKWSGRGVSAAGTELGGLKSARAKARAGIADRTASLPTPVAGPVLHAEVVEASKKFEVSAEELRAASKLSVDGPKSTGPADAKPSGSTPKSAKDDAKDGMSALLRAKKKAREGMEDQ